MVRSLEVIRSNADSKLCTLRDQSDDDV